MQVLKFGGTSVASSEAMLQVVDIVRKALEEDRTIVVSSAVSGCTDALIETGRKAAARDESYKTLIEDLRKRHYKIIGELLPEGYRERTAASVDKSTTILTDKFLSLGITCQWLDARDFVQVRDGEVDEPETYARVAKTVNSNPHVELFIVPGFIATDGNGRVTTLGRGGSDFTASLVAVGIHARRVEIWTDVPGIMTANPKIVPTARPIPNISYRAAQELSHFGAKVIYPPTIQPVVDEGIPIIVKDTFHPEEPGTLVERNPPRVRDGMIGIAHSDHIALISLEGSGMVGVPGFSSRLFDALSRKGINIILITQASSVHSMCIAIAEHRWAG